MATKFLGITIPAELYDEIEEKRKDIPRSYFYKKLIDFAYKNYSLGYVERRMTASLPHKPPKIYSIVSSQPDGFVVHSNEMDLNQPYWFQYEDSTYEIKKNLNKELVMLEVA